MLFRLEVKLIRIVWTSFCTKIQTVEKVIVFDLMIRIAGTQSSANLSIFSNLFLTSQERPVRHTDQDASNPHSLFHSLFNKSVSTCVKL